MITQMNEIIFQLVTNNYVSVMDSDGNNYIVDHLSSLVDETIFTFDHHGEEVELNIHDLAIIQ
jgi:hypothetical protein